MFLDKDEAQTLNSGNFDDVMVVATKTAQIKCSSFDYYCTSHNPACEQIRFISMSGEEWFQ